MAKVQSLVTTFQDVEESNFMDKSHFDHIRTIENSKSKDFMPDSEWKILTLKVQCVSDII